jgi:hypothetical protein
MQVPVVETPWQGTFPDLPNWSENYCLAAFDPGCGVGLWLHMGRWRKDLTMWREIVTIRCRTATVAHRATVMRATATLAVPATASASSNPVAS